MIYWHVEKNSTCIYSQLKTCSSSEVSAMINGVLKHCTSMEVKKNYVDSHGQSEVAFALTHLLGFQLMPRLKRTQKHWEKRLTARDLQAITPLIFGHVNPYGLFKLDLKERIERLSQPLVA